MVELPRCKICRNKDRKKIQNALDNGATNEYIRKVYGISYPVIYRHKKENHKQILRLFEHERYRARRNADNNIEILTTYIDLWYNQVKEGRLIKDNDALRAIEFFEKLCGNLIDKTELTVRKDLGQVIDKYLNSGILDTIEDTEDTKKEKEDKDKTD